MAAWSIQRFTFSTHDSGISFVGSWTYSKEVGPEPYAKRRSHGLVMAEGGEKMSKSKGNVVNPDDVICCSWCGRLQGL